MATELKPCPECGHEKPITVDWRVHCPSCGHSEYHGNWNTRAMPKCVRCMLTAVQCASADFDHYAADVRKYYGEGGE